MKINKSNLIYILLLFGLSSCSSSKKAVTTKVPVIRKIERTNPDISLPVEIREFDASGNLIIQEKYDKNNKLYSGTMSKYNEYGDLILSRTYYTPQAKTRGNQTTTMKLGDLAREYKYTYDNDGKMKSRHSKSPSSNYKEQTTFIYINEKLVKELTDIESRGEKSTRTIIHKYNEINKIDTTMQYSGEKLYKLLVHKYDERNRLIESNDTRHRDGKEDFNIVEKFDELGNMVTMIYRNQAGANEKTINKYNSTGQVTLRATYNQNGKITHDESCKYELDRNGNWISSECIINGKLGSIVTREIEYYK